MPPQCIPVCPTTNICELFAVGFHGLTPSPEIKTLIREYGLGGIVLFKRNIRDAAQLQVRPNSNCRL